MAPWCPLRRGRPMRPWTGFLIGIIVSNIVQWGTWLSNRKPGQSYLGYWRVGIPHFTMNIWVDVAAYVAWDQGWLVKLEDMIPGIGNWMNALPFTPQVGLMLGMGVDLTADKLAFLVRKVLGSRLPFLNQPADPKARRQGG
jgi:hypothetical protein